MQRRVNQCLLLAACLFFAADAAAEERAFHEARFEKGELKYISGVPVLLVRGTPAEIGRQKAALTGKVFKAIDDYPRKLLRGLKRENRLPKFAAAGQKLLQHAPADYREELQAFTEAAGVEIDQCVLANTIMDTYRGAIGCSSVIVSAEKSATHGPLFGRNLDFPPLGILDRYGLVTVHRPRGKHAFAAVGLPGVLGCLSGMNDAGLALAVHEVHFTADGASRLNLKGMPYTFCFRRILEECSTIAEAEKLLRSVERTTMLSLVVCDRQGGAVLEMTPKSVVLRQGERGVCACVNDFRSKELATWTLSFRYGILTDCAKMKTITIDDLAGKLDAVNLGWMTMQTMIFEPAALRLHVSLGPAPSSKQPLRKLDLAALFGK